MRRRSPLRFPSYRNLCIYHQLAYQRRTQVTVAAELGISQRRVSRIGQQVRAWVDSRVRPRQYVGQPGMRLHLAIALERIRLQQAHGPLVELFTGPDEIPRSLRRRVTVVNGQARCIIEVTDQPNLRLMNEALTVQVRLAELEAVANLGPLFDLPHQVHETRIQEAIPAPDSFSTASKSPSNDYSFMAGGVLPAASPSM